MDNGTDTWVIVLAAFGGGLFGAILQPVVTYAMQWLRSGEEIRKARERHLRRMMEAQMRWSRNLQAVMLIATLSGRDPVAFARASGDYEAILGELPPWRPHRIRDEQLSGMATRYTGLNTALMDHYRESVAEQAIVEELCNALKKLEPKIDERMDELAWPEAEN